MLFPPGTILAVLKGLFVHYGIYTESGTVIAASGHTGRVEEFAFSHFAPTGKVTTASFPGRLCNFEVVSRARSSLGTPYNLFRANCEHFVRWCHGLKPESPQLRNAALIGAAALTAFFLIVGGKK